MSALNVVPVSTFLDHAEKLKIQRPDPESEATPISKKAYQRGAGEGNRYNYLKSDLGQHLQAHPESTVDELVRYAEQIIRPKLGPPPVSDSEWRLWKVRKLCMRLHARQSEQSPREKKPKTRDELILGTVDEIRDQFTLATDTLSRVHWYDESAGRYVDDDHKKFSGILISNFRENKKPLAMGDSDVEKMVLHLNHDGTPQFWPEPPVTRVNLANGIFDVETGTLGDHTPEFLYPNQFDVPWLPNAECTFTDDILHGLLNEDEVQFVYELLGYCLLPVTDFHTAVLFQGKGSNGKTTVLDIFRYLMGPRNYSTVTLHQMEGNNFAAHQMVGKLINIEPDMSERRLPGSAKFKAIVGGDPITVEQKYKDPRTVKLYTRLLMSSNWFPRSADSSPGFFRRWMVLPFDKKDFRDEGADGKDRILPSVLKARIQGEAPGILAKALRAFHKVRKASKFTESGRMKEAKLEFKALTDTLSAWLEENTVSGPKTEVQQKQLRAAYHKFCDSKDYPRLSEKEFSEKVLEYKPEISTEQRHGNRYFVGIGMKASEPYHQAGGGSRFDFEGAPC